MPASNRIHHYCAALQKQTSWILTYEWLLWSPVMIRHKLSGTHNLHQLRVCHHNIGGPAQKELENCAVLLWPVQKGCVVKLSKRALQLHGNRR